MGKIVRCEEDGEEGGRLVKTWEEDMQRTEDREEGLEKHRKRNGEDSKV
jgi:hypothetical protein